MASKICFESTARESRKILCDAGRRRRRAAHLVRRRQLFDAGVVARGDYIAFTKQGGGQFAIGIMKTDGSGERILTSGFTTKGRHSRRTGRVLMFFREAGGGGGPSLFTIDISGRNE